MTVLSAMQSAAVRLIGRRPSTFFGSAETFEVEMVDLVNEVAKDIVEHHDWQALTRIHTITGDGVSRDYPMPDDYDRMLIDSDLFDPNNWAWGYWHIRDLNEWLYQVDRGIGLVPPGAWTIYGDEFHFIPTPATGATAQFPYISKLYAIPSNGGARKAAFTRDDDTFVLDERLLTLGLIYRYKAMKEMSSDSDIEEYNDALSRRMAKDAGPTKLTSRPSRLRGFTIAYPWSLGP